MLIKNKFETKGNYMKIYQVQKIQFVYRGNARLDIFFYIFICLIKLFNTFFFIKFIAIQFYYLILNENNIYKNLKE